MKTIASSSAVHPDVDVTATATIAKRISLRMGTLPRLGGVVLPKDLPRPVQIGSGGGDEYAVATRAELGVVDDGRRDVGQPAVHEHSEHRGQRPEQDRH